MRSIDFKKPVLVAVGLVLALCVHAQTYELSGKWYTAEFVRGAWHGKHGLPNVYCLTFPSAGAATEIGQGFFNARGIFLTQVRYPDQLTVSIVASSVPAGRTSDQEVSSLLALERGGEASYGTTYNISETQSDFGRVVNLRIKNVAPSGRSAPFPLVRPMIRPAREPIETLSVHRLFVRGPDRFEVAVFQVAPTPSTETTEAEMTARLTAIADQTVTSLQTCTGSIPVRIPK